ncbi:hypothetical protein JR316_0005255 [Psilocybe cubensis]|uniref:Uncharacterized protein n=2 Tax=Psilocybe cubensis TaxID=181762 RepID=A0ACB8H673_PSICU|nr:hypothetical protein JR316_0005255 [Psilocybe cubensis]KAH9483152.1 hypothetical protein JR316_0005255 [Psilocybe cubensis]
MLLESVFVAVLGSLVSANTSSIWSTTDNVYTTSGWSTTDRVITTSQWSTSDKVITTSQWSTSDRVITTSQRSISDTIITTSQLPTSDRVITTSQWSTTDRIITTSKTISPSPLPTTSNHSAVSIANSTKTTTRTTSDAVFTTSSGIAIGANLASSSIGGDAPSSSQPSSAAQLSPDFNLISVLAVGLYMVYGIGASAFSLL